MQGFDRYLIYEILFIIELLNLALFRGKIANYRSYFLPAHFQPAISKNLERAIVES